MAEMCISPIGKSEIPPKYPVAIHCTIVLKCHSDLQCLPIRMRNIPATINVPSTLLKHLLKCIFPDRSVVQLALPLSDGDQQGVHSPSDSEQVVSHSRVSILRTCLLSTALQFGSSGVPHAIERAGLLSGLHASNSAQPDTVPWHRAFPSQSHPLDRRAHLKTATLSQITSHRVIEILELQ
jgi:hypothetical protein